MWHYLNNITGVIANVIIILSAAWIITKYLRIKKAMSSIDEIVNNAVSEIQPPEASEPKEVGSQSENLREHLVGIAMAGKSKEYLGKNISSDEIERLDQKELRKLYARYEICMGGLVTKSMKSHIITAYTKIVGSFLPKNLVIANHDALEESLNKGPFIDLALSKWTCGLYHKFGHMIGPIEAVLLTSNHIQKNPEESESPPPAERSNEDLSAKSDACQS